MAAPATMRTCPAAFGAPSFRGRCRRLKKHDIGGGEPAGSAQGAVVAVGRGRTARTGVAVVVAENEPIVEDAVNTVVSQAFSWCYTVPQVRGRAEGRDVPEWLLTASGLRSGC